MEDFLRKMFQKVRSSSWPTLIFVAFMNTNSTRKNHVMPNPVAVRSKAWGLRLLACWDCGFEFRLGTCMSLWWLCVVRWRPLRRADHSSRGDPPTVVCLSMIVKSRRWEGLGLLGGGSCWDLIKEYCGWDLLMRPKCWKFPYLVKVSTIKNSVGVILLVATLEGYYGNIRTVSGFHQIF